MKQSSLFNIVTIGVALFFVGCNLPTSATQESSSSVVVDATQNSSAALASSNSLSTGTSASVNGGNEWVAWNNPAPSNYVTETWPLSINRESSLLLLSQSDSYCENGALVQNANVDTIHYQASAAGLMIWNTNDCQGTQFTGSNNSVLGDWAMSGAVASPAGVSANCKVNNGPSEFQSMNINIQESVMTVAGEQCPTKRINGMFNNPNLKLEVVDCNRVKIGTANQVALVRMSLLQMKGMHLELFFQGTVCTLDAPQATDATMCSTTSGPWNSFSQCVSRLGVKLWADQNQTSTPMPAGMQACNYGNKCLEGATAMSSCTGVPTTMCPQQTTQLICPLKDGKVYYYDQSVTTCQSI